MSLAAQNFLNKNDQYIVAQVQDVLEGNMREIIGQMKLEEMVSNRKAFAEKVQENAVPGSSAHGSLRSSASMFRAFGPKRRDQ